MLLALRTLPGTAGTAVSAENKSHKWSITFPTFLRVQLYKIYLQEYDPEKLAELRKVAPDFKESFDLGNDAPTARLPNVWPPEAEIPSLRGFKAHAKEFFEQGLSLEKKVLKALAMGIPGVPDNFFDEYHADADNQIRLLHYPGAPAEVFVSGAKGRVAPHTVCTSLHYASEYCFYSIVWFWGIRILGPVRYSSKTQRIHAEASKWRTRTNLVISSLRQPWQAPSYSTSVTSSCVGPTVGTFCSVDEKKIHRPN